MTHSRLFRCLCTWLTCALLAVSASGAFAGRMALIIDDVGNNWARGEAAINLPGRVTLSVLPGLPSSRALAELAHEQGRPVMLHMPMENHGQLRLGPKGITLAMSDDDIQSTVESALRDVPHAQGINNHMGSRFTESAVGMRAVLQVLKRHDLYFLDSLTTPRTVGRDVAEQESVPYLARQIFLDHERSEAFMSRQFSSAMDIMDRHGEVIVIGHPYPETLAFLNWVLPLATRAGVELVAPSELIAPRLVQPGLADAAQ